jgi:predicted dehydrogenase
MNLPKEIVRFAIIGSGAIAEESYLPAAEMASNAVVSHLVDLDIERAREVGRRFQISNFVSDYREIFGKVDAVVVATPPNSHAQISIDCLNHGLHVLCEKPLSTTVKRAKDMVEAGERTHNHLGVGMVRRLSWSSQILKKLIGSDLLGHIHRFDIEEGWEFNWPLRTGHLFQNENSRGVIADTGSHLFDLLFWILGTQRAEVLSCKDDNRGGIEANALIDLAVEGSSQRSTGRIELSFTRRLRNTMIFCGERGCLEAETVGAKKVYFYPSGQNDEPLILRPCNSRPGKRNEEFSLQLSNFAESVINGVKKYVLADEAVMTMSLVEECYGARRLSVQPWEMKHLEPFFGERKNDE